MRTILTSVLVLLSASAYAQDMPGPKGPIVTIAPAPLVTVMQGKKGTVPLSFRVANGYHINSSQPKSEFLIPTTLKVDATTDIVIGKVIFPAGRDMSFPFAPDEKLNVYSGDFSVGVVVRPLHSVPKGKYMVRGTLKYQACDNSACYPPKQLPLSFEVKVSKAPPAPRKNPAQSPHAHR
ncbi:MAG: protein-disulfide reductase DsbD domain-containing protein [Terriglobales bacterium]